MTKPLSSFSPSTNSEGGVPRETLVYIGMEMGLRKVTACAAALAIFAAALSMASPASAGVPQFNLEFGTLEGFSATSPSAQTATLTANSTQFAEGASAHLELTITGVSCASSGAHANETIRLILVSFGDGYNLSSGPVREPSCEGGPGTVNFVVEHPYYRLGETTAVAIVNWTDGHLTTSNLLNLTIQPAGSSLVQLEYWFVGTAVAGIAIASIAVWALRSAPTRPPLDV